MWTVPIFSLHFLCRKENYSCPWVREKKFAAVAEGKKKCEQSGGFEKRINYTIFHVTSNIAYYGVFSWLEKKQMPRGIEWRSALTHTQNDYTRKFATLNSFWQLNNSQNVGKLFIYKGGNTIKVVEEHEKKIVWFEDFFWALLGFVCVVVGGMKSFSFGLRNENQEKCENKAISWIKWDVTGGNLSTFLWCARFLILEHQYCIALKEWKKGRKCRLRGWKNMDDDAHISGTWMWCCVCAWNGK